MNNVYRATAHGSQTVSGGLSTTEDCSTLVLISEHQRTFAADIIDNGRAIKLTAKGDELESIIADMGGMANNAIDRQHQQHADNLQEWLDVYAPILCDALNLLEAARASKLPAKLKATIQTFLDNTKLAMADTL
jgi:hypothetical protein